MSDEQRFGVTGGNIITGGGASKWSSEFWPGVGGLIVWIRHKLAKGHRPDRFERVGDTRFSRCAICGATQVFERGSIGHGWICALECFASFQDTRVELLFEEATP